MSVQTEIGSSEVSAGPSLPRVLNFSPNDVGNMVCGLMRYRSGLINVHGDPQAALEVEADLRYYSEHILELPSRLFVTADVEAESGVEDSAAQLNQDGLLVVKDVDLSANRPQPLLRPLTDIIMRPLTEQPMVVALGGYNSSDFAQNGHDYRRDNVLRLYQLRFLNLLVARFEIGYGEHGRKTICQLPARLGQLG